MEFVNVRQISKDTNVINALKDTLGRVVINVRQATSGLKTNVRLVGVQDSNQMELVINLDNATAYPTLLV